MDSIKLRNALGRPRVFSVVDPEGEHDSIRMRSGATVSVDVRLLTPEIVENIKGGHLVLLGGKLPEELNPYPEKKAEVAALESRGNDDGDCAEGGKKIIKKGAKA